MNDDVVIDKILSIDIKVQTSDNKEKIIRYTDFKFLDDLIVTKDITEHYTGGFSYKPSLNGISFDVKCKGYSIEVINIEK